MPFKGWSSAQNVKAEEKPDDKAKATPATAQPAVAPGKTPAEAAPASKS